MHLLQPNQELVEVGGKSCIDFSEFGSGSRGKCISQLSKKQGQEVPQGRQERS